jgi:hypothetical protein
MIPAGPPPATTQETLLGDFVIGACDGGDEN